MQRQVDLCELEANLIYGVSSRSVSDPQRNTVSRKQNKTKKLNRKEGGKQGNINRLQSWTWWHTPEPRQKKAGLYDYLWLCRAMRSSLAIQDLS